VWDLRWKGAPVIHGAKIDMGDPDPGPDVLPGTYTLKLIAGADAATTTVTVRPDPRVKVSDADREAQRALAARVLADVTTITDTVTQLRGLAAQLRARRALLAGIADAQPQVTALDAALAKLDAIEAKLHNPKAEVTYDILAMRGGAQLYSRLIPFYNVVAEGDGAPTQGQRQVYEALSAELQQVLKEYRAALGAEVAKVDTGGWLVKPR
jgi:hypothetical protein